jgi:hypothetical protein
MASREATVKDIADFFNRLVAEGKGTYKVDVATPDGDSYDLFLSETNKNDPYGVAYEQNNSIAYVYDKLKVVSIGDLETENG